MEQIAIAESQRLTQLEVRIREGLKTFVDVGAALLEIRDARLYRQDYSTFEEYCQERWGLKERQAYRLMDASAVVAHLESCPIGQLLPTTESQVRPLTKLEPEEQTIVWQRATETAPNGKVTAAHVQNVADEYKKVKSAPEPEAYDFSDDAADYDWTEDEDQLEQEPAQPEIVVTTSKPHVTNNSGDHKWYTPSEYIEAARNVLGVIELDPASSPEANEVVKAKVYYTINDDGLQYDWHGKVWMNPPYGRDVIDRFMTKLAYHIENGDVTEAIVLVNNATETEWFNEIVRFAKVVVFPKSRIKYWKPEIDKLDSPLQGQAFLYVGDNASEFIREFKRFGWYAVIAEG